MSFENPKNSEIAKYLKEARTIAIVGLSNKPERTSYQIADFLQQQGYHIIPVNPILAGQTILDEKVFASLSDIPVHIDIVDIFRRSEFLPEIAKEFIQVNADVFWAQLGIESQEAASILEHANKKNVVMDRCIKIEFLTLKKTENA